jgi:para-nitrobenzyl esterase
MSLFPVIDGDVVPDVPQTAIAEGSAAGMPLLIGTTQEEYRLFLVSTGLAEVVTADLLPVLAARYGWPAQVIDTYAANRPHANGR